MTMDRPQSDGTQNPQDERGPHRNQVARSAAHALPGGGHPTTNPEDSESPPTDRRRSSLIDSAIEHGLSPDAAEILYDIALEEGLDPIAGLEIVRSGLLVRDRTETGETSPEAPIADRYVPTWVLSTVAPERARQERILRGSFRRLRRFLEEEGDLEQAMLKLANDPDVDRRRS